MQETDKQVSGIGETLPFGAKREVFPSNPLPSFDSGTAAAYLARAKGAGGENLMLLLCRSGYPPRTDIFSQIRSIDNPAMLRVVDQGSIIWNDGARYPGFIVEQPQQPRLWQSIDETHAPLGEDFVNRQFIAPIIDALHDLSDRGIMHGNVRITNIFWRDGGGGVPQLGECLTAPPGIGQPVLFEPPDRAQVPPAARGLGNVADDMYALGVTIVLLILGQNPLRGMDDAGIIRAKLERGTFGAMIGQHRIAPSHIELLRGLLHHDPKQRWTPSEIEQWLNGQRLTPKQSETGHRATRAFMFEGKELWQIQQIVQAFAANIPAAAQAIERGELDKWLRRSVADDDRADRVQAAIDTLKASGRTANFDAQQVTMVCMALDPDGPIFYRGQAFMPFGIGPALAEAVRTNGNIQILAEVISNQFVNFWINMQESKTELVPLGQTFERVRGFIERGTVGGGIERAVYELNPTLPCLSPLLGGQHAMTAKDLLPALEKTARGARGAEPVDRHLAAWIASRDRSMDYLMRPLGETGPRRALALLSLYSEWQRKHGPDKLPALAGWLVGLLGPLTQRYHYRPRREEVAGLLKQATDEGKLEDLVKLLDEPKLVERDQQNFTAARELYRMTTQQIAILERQIKQRDEVARRYGRPAATYIAWVLAAIAVIFSMMRMMAGG